MALAYIWPILLEMLPEIAVIVIILTRLVPVRKGLSWIMLVATLLILISNIANIIARIIVSSGDYYSHLFVIYAVNIFYIVTQVVFWILLAVFIFQTAKALAHKDNAEVSSEALVEAPSAEIGRGSLILTFGILGLLMFWPLGLTAWIMGASDLGKARRGVTFSDKNMVKTRYGMTLGIISTLLPVIFIFAVFGIALLR
ncbi:hypothetical protein [Zymobacter palmae]|uniref:Amino acid permeases n=1 Tax=Zymobacter palmae TaxID=33074 RepID=A0A348HGX1_9GAMM|nr:hypothetical protein [Zymobacter palmae]BBG30873.1 amino acid permeases [Zymobacter palmae]